MEYPPQIVVTFEHELVFLWSFQESLVKNEWMTKWNSSILGPESMYMLWTWTWGLNIMYQEVKEHKSKVAARWGEAEMESIIGVQEDFGGMWETSVREEIACFPWLVSG
jgi:hypothetical protein